MEGFLNLNKPAGWTSHDCVGKLRRIFHTRQVGHGGTLDPDATGVLPVAIGRATRYLQFLPGGKSYRATFVLGQSSTTDDSSGEITARQPVPTLDEATVRAALANFVGNIQQIPPVFSAIRRQGKRLYELAREGATAESLQLEPRSVQIDRIVVLAWRGGDFPEVDVEIDCGAGTYIRAIARDLGHLLGTGALMSRLHRTRSGPFVDADSIALQTLLETDHPETMLQPISAAFAELGEIELEKEEAHRWCCGQKLPHPDPHNPNLLKVTCAGQFLGLAQLQDDYLKQMRVLASRG
ncbi:MAG: tRNA pseudouridine(55) synthase TruB [Synechococcus sp.]